MEGRDCPICVTPFKDDDVIIQLRGHQFNIYKEKCIKEMLSFTEIERKCLISRQCILDSYEDTIKEKEDWIRTELVQ